MAPVARRIGESFGVLEPFQTVASVEGQINELGDVLLFHAAVPAILAGFSWGAWLALLTAAKYPAIVKKVITVSSGAFEERYAEQLYETRLSRLTHEERSEFERIATTLNDSEGENRNALLARFGELASKADTFAPVEDGERDGEVLPDAHIFRQVWSDAAGMRRSGELLRRVSLVACPVVALHGGYDPSPVAGTAEPLAAALSDFRLIMLERCGHTPWIERHAREEFYRVLLREIESG